MTPRQCLAATLWLTSLFRIATLGCWAFKILTVRWWKAIKKKLAYVSRATIEESGVEYQAKYKKCHSQQIFDSFCFNFGCTFHLGHSFNFDNCKDISYKLIFHAAYKLSIITQDTIACCLSCRWQVVTISPKYCSPTRKVNKWKNPYKEETIMIEWALPKPATTLFELCHRNVLPMHSDSACSIQSEGMNQFWSRHLWI